VKQVLQNFWDGTLIIAEIPAPRVGPGQVLVRNQASLISPGTERATVQFAQKSLAGKAISRMDLVSKVVAKARSDGIQDTLRMVRSRLGVPAAMGYSCAGEVVDVGTNVEGIRIGDRAACAGQNYASHAEFVCVPKNLVVRIPDEVSFGEAAYVTLGAIAIQGVRQAAPALGEAVVVIGLGLLGQLTVQLLKANGCKVIGSDFSAKRCNLAKELAADVVAHPDDLAGATAAATAGWGADAVIITASSTSDDAIRQAAEVSRKKGRIVVVGAVGMNLPREPFYLRELELRLSMSGGPGRYDPRYEEQGRDYPYPYVRWTENRNMESFLELVRAKRVDVERLTTHRFAVDAAPAAYRLVVEDQEASLGVLLEYGSDSVPVTRQTLQLRSSTERVRMISLIGVGSHVMDRLVPALSGRAGLEVRGVCSGTGKTAARVATKLNAHYATSDYREILDDSETHAVIIGTRHNLHAEIAAAALSKGKHVFVEKPPCLTDAELETLAAAYAEGVGRGATLFVGYNRRYSSHTEQVKSFLCGRRTPLVMLYRVNAGALAADHWLLDESVGGGRIIGECCHFVDFLLALCGARPESVFATAPSFQGRNGGRDEAVILLEFFDGSVGSVVYTGAGDKGLAKERCEIFVDQASVVLDDFRCTEFYRQGKRRIYKTRLQDKGYAKEVDTFIESINNQKSMVQPFEDLYTVSQAMFRAVDSTRTGERYALRPSPIAS